MQLPNNLVDRVGSILPMSIHFAFPDGGSEIEGITAVGEWSRPQRS